MNVRAALVVLAAIGGDASQLFAQTATPLTSIETVPNVRDSTKSSAFTADGARAITGGSSNIQLWDVESGRLLRTFIDQSAGDAVTFSPAGNQILSASADNQLMRIWDTKTGRSIQTFTLNLSGESVTALDFSSDATKLASASHEKGIKIWDTATGSLLLSGIGGDVSAVAFSADGTQIVSGSGSEVKIWDAKTGRAIRSLSGHDRYSSVGAVAFSSDGSKIISSATTDKVMRLWDAKTGQVLKTFAHGSAIWKAGISPDGRRVFSGGWDKTVKLWDATSGRLIREQSGFELPQGRFSPDGARLLIGSNSDTPMIQLQSAEDGRLVRNFGVDRDRRSVGAYSADASRIISTGNSIRLWDAASDTLINSYPAPGNNAYYSDVSTDGRRAILQLEDDKVLRVVDPVAGGELAMLRGPQSIKTARLSPDAGAVASVVEKTVNIYDLKAGRTVQTLKHNDTTGVTAVAFSPDGTRICVGDYDRYVKLWDAVTGRLIWTYRIPFQYSLVWELQFSPDGKFLAVTSGKESPRTLDAATGRLIREFAGHRPGSIVSHVSISRDSSRILSASDDDTVKLWDAASGRLLRSFETGYVTSLAFSPDGRYGLFGNETWNIESGEKVATTYAFGQSEWLTITPEGFFAASEHGAEILTIVRGLDFWSIDQFYQSLYRPDLVREKLAGDPRGLVREAAAKLDLNKALESGDVPLVTLVSPGSGTTAPTNQIVAEVEITARNNGGIGRVEWRVNGLTIGVETPTPSPAGLPLRLSHQVALNAGSNTIEVVAYNAANLITSEPARSSVTSAAGALVSGRLFVLAAGVNNYADERFKLALSVADANALAQAFADAGKIQYSSVEIKMLVDAEVTADKLNAAFADLAAKMASSDVFVLYLAGHGKTIDGRYYYVPQTFKIDGGVTNASINAAVVAQGIAQETWQGWFASIPARRSVILFDTCESGTLTSDESHTKSLEQGAANDRLAQATGRSIITASSGTTEAFEGYRGHGLFTYNILDAFDRGDGDRNGTIEVSELAAYVYAQVSAISEKVFRQRQEPQMKITANYPLIRQGRVLSDVEDLEAGALPTVQLRQEAQLQIKPISGATVVRSLSANTKVNVLKSDGGWSLIASEGKPLGYVATRDLSMAN